MAVSSLNLADKLSVETDEQSVIGQQSNFAAKKPYFYTKSNEF
tara:strand:- start:5861 stop:5989 length:129 start_codon:yes stop_codon:yes gene_type:complete